MTRKWIGIVCFVLFGLFLIRPAFGQVTHGINWTWAPITTDAVGNTIVVSGYNFYCSTNPAGPFTTKANNALIPTPTYLLAGLTAGSTYYCQYTGVNTVGEGGHSPTSLGVTFQFLPVAGAAAPAGIVQ